LYPRGYGFRECDVEVSERMREYRSVPKVQIDVFEYLDYRAYLRDYYAAKKAEKKGFSYRSFARRAGLGAPNHLKRVMDGGRNLSADSAIKYANAIGFSEDANRYFVDLVAFNQARTSRDRDRAYQRISGSRGYRKAQQLDIAHAAYYSTWYVPAIRELAARSDFRDDPKWIAKRMLPPIKPTDAARALDTLLRLELLSRDADGKVVQGETVVTTGPETRGHHIRQYHRAMMERAAESMDLVDAAQRDISSLTFCVGEDGLRRVKTRIQRFRKELITMLTQENDGDQVVQLNMHLFPLTTHRSDEGMNE